METFSGDPISTSLPVDEEDELEHEDDTNEIDGAGGAGLTQPLLSRLTLYYLRSGIFRDLLNLYRSNETVWSLWKSMVAAAIA